MTDRYFALAVILENDIRSDDAQPIIEAIKMVKGVLSVKPHVTDMSTLMAEERARHELGARILTLVYQG